MSSSWDLTRRRSTFKNRSSGLMKKLHELSTLCGIDTCMIVYTNDETTPAPVIYPEKPAVVRAMIKRLTERSQGRKTTTHITQKSWDDRLKEIPDHELKTHMSAINAKMESVQSRIQLLKSSSPDFCIMSTSPTCSVDDFLNMPSQGMADLYEKFYEL